MQSSGASLILLSSWHGRVVMASSRKAKKTKAVRKTGVKTRVKIKKKKAKTASEHLSSERSPSRGTYRPVEEVEEQTTLNEPEERPGPRYQKPDGQGLYGASGRTRARLDFVSSLLGQGKYDHEVLDICVESPLFDYKNAGNNARSERNTKRCTRRTIKQDYLDRVKREWKVKTIDPAEELRKGYARFMEAFRLAERLGDPKGMAMAQRYLAKMLGLQGNDANRGLSAEGVVEQLRAMQGSVPRA